MKRKIKAYLGWHNRGYFFIRFVRHMDDDERKRFIYSFYYLSFFFYLYLLPYAVLIVRTSFAY